MKYAGEKCKSSNECYSGIWSSGICIGKEIGSSWESTNVWAEGYTCLFDEWIR